MRRGLLPYVMIAFMTAIGLVNFFAPFFYDYQTDPLITYIFMAMAATIAGFKGLNVAAFFRPSSNANESPKKEVE